MAKTNNRTLLTAALAAVTLAVGIAAAFSIAATQTLAQTNQEMTQEDMTAMMQQGQALEMDVSAMNATDMMGGMSMLSIDSMSMVDSVMVTGINVESNDEISVNLKYVGNESSPRITATAMAVTTTGMMMSQGQMMGHGMGMNMAHGNDQNSMSGQSNMHKSMLSGSNVLDSGWGSPSTVTIKLQGSTTPDDIAYVMVMVFPFLE